MIGEGGVLCVCVCFFKHWGLEVCEGGNKLSALYFRKIDPAAMSETY